MIRKRFDVFWCLEWECCTFERLMEIHQYFTLALREMTMHFCIIFFQQDYPDMSLPMQGLALHRQMSGGDSEPLPGVSGSQQHIPLPQQQQQQQQQQQGGAQQSSSGTHIGHPHSQQQQPPLLQLQHQPGLSQPGLSQQGLSQPYLVRQLAGAGGQGRLDRPLRPPWPTRLNRLRHWASSKAFLLHTNRSDTIHTRRPHCMIESCV